MEEKRKFRRLVREMPARHRSHETDAIEITHAKDISTGGIRLATDSKLDIGAKLNIEVNITGSENPYYAIGEVVWLREKENTDEKKFDMGVRFIRVVKKEDLAEF